jgi:hypothetical protein
MKFVFAALCLLVVCVPVAADPPVPQVPGYRVGGEQDAKLRSGLELAKVELEKKGYDSVEYNWCQAHLYLLY